MNTKEANNNWGDWEAIYFDQDKRKLKWVEEEEEEDMNQWGDDDVRKLLKSWMIENRECFCFSNLKWERVSAMNKPGWVLAGYDLHTVCKPAQLSL